MQSSKTRTYSLILKASELDSSVSACH